MRKIVNFTIVVATVLTLLSCGSVKYLPVSVSQRQSFSNYKYAYVDTYNSPAQEFASKLVRENPDAVICSDEIGSGIHPIDPEERRWREETGRALCILAEASETVTRVFCGIPQRIK